MQASQAPSRSVRQKVLVGENAIKRRPADLELPRRAQLVAAIEVEHVLHVAVDDGVEGQIGG